MAQIKKKKWKTRQKAAGQLVAKRRKAQGMVEPQPIIMNTYVSYPGAITVPVDNLAALPLPLYKCSNDGWQCRNVDVYAKLFEEERNPLYALRVLDESYRAEVYPPLYVLKFLAESVQRYMDSDGQKSLDKCLGLRGAKTVVADVRLADGRVSVCLDLITWKKMFGKPYSAVWPVIEQHHGAVKSVLRYFLKGERPEWQQAKLLAKKVWNILEERRIGGKDPHFRRDFISKYPLALLEKYPKIFGPEILFDHKDFPQTRGRI